MTTEEIIVILSNNLKSLQDLKSVTVDVDKNNTIDQKISDTETSLLQLLQRFEKNAQSS